jgi:hypothetical protein
VEKKKKLKEFWSSDPVHLSGPGYTKLASEVITKGESGLVRAASSLGNKRTGQPPSKPPPKRARWVEDDDVTATQDSCGTRPRTRSWTREGLLRRPRPLAEVERPRRASRQPQRQHVLSFSKPVFENILYCIV